MINFTIGLLFYLGQYFVYHYSKNDAEEGGLDDNINPFNSMLAIFIMIFGAIEAGQAN